jgi:hypothetical protein
MAPFLIERGLGLKLCCWPRNMPPAAETEMQQPKLASGVDLRRRLGRYDTPRPLSQAVADWAIRSPRDEILEPSSGSGVFVASALHRLRCLRCGRPEDQVWACDVDFAAVEETVRETGLAADHVWHADFLSAAGADGVRGRKFDCVIGNPPFVSLHGMEPGQRAEAYAAVRRLGVALDRKASLWAYFLAAGAHSLRLGGRLAMVVPQCVLHAVYARALLTEVGRCFKRILLLGIRERCFLSGGAGERVVLLLGEERQDLVRAPELLLHESADVCAAQQFLVNAALRPPETLPRLDGHAVPHLLSASRTPLLDLSSAPCGHTLGDFADITIGVVTGANDFFLLTEEQRKRHHLPESSVVRALPSFRFCKGLVFSGRDWGGIRRQGERCWLLFPREDECRRTVLRYLARFPEPARAGNITFGKRMPWFRVDLGRRPDAFMQYMGTRAPRLALAAPRTTCTNTVHRVRFRERTGRLERIAIALSLLSTFSQLSAEFEGRPYRSGALKLEPCEARQVRLLLPRPLSRARIQACREHVDRLMRAGDRASVTSTVDEWLYGSIPRLAQALPLESLREALRDAISRRVGNDDRITPRASHRTRLSGWRP